MIKYFSVLYDGLEDIEKIEFEYYKEDINWNFAHFWSGIHGPAPNGPGLGLAKIFKPRTRKTNIWKDNRNDPY